MAPRLLGKTTLKGVDALRSASGAALEQYNRLRAALAERVGPDAAELLAEPIVTWGGESGDGSVSWYTDAHGDPRPLTAVPLERRLVLEDRLRKLLSRAGLLLGDPAIGGTLQRALCVLSPASLWAVGDQIVLTEWGLAPSGSNAADPTALLRRSPLAPYLPPESAPAAPMPAQASVSATAPSAAATAAAASTVRGAPPPPPVAPARNARVRSALNWWLAPAALVIAAIFLALGYWKGSILARERAAARPNNVTVLDDAAVRDATERQQALNASLERQIEERKRLLSGNVCLADPAAMPRLGPDRDATPPPAAVQPPPGGQPFQGNLADLLKQAIVMVIVPQPEGRGVMIGSGFYVTPDTVVTNRHVVENAEGGRAVITNEKLGHVAPVQVAAQSDTSDVGSLDVAVLKAPNNPAVQPLSMTATAAELDPVIAAGYPALVIEGDAATQRLLNGDLNAAPSLVLSDGRINAIQVSAAGIKIMPHSASISGGNSGGPLVDACGRVVGVNTFIRADQEQAAHASYAQKSEAVMSFLKDHQVSITEVTGPCAPTGPAPAAPPASAAAVPGSAPAPPPAPSLAH